MTEDQLVRENTPLVRHIVKQYRSHLKHEYDDLMSCGLIGLLKGIRRHNPEKGSLSTICWFWIKREINMYLRKIKKHNQNTRNILFDKSYTVDNETIDDIFPECMTTEEKQVINMLAEGYKPKDIAAEIGKNAYQVKVIIGKATEKIKDAN